MKGTGRWRGGGDDRDDAEGDSGGRGRDGVAEDEVETGLL